MSQLVALVDDDELNLKLMDVWLTGAGYRTLLCSDHDAAYDLLRIQVPHLIVLDLMAGERYEGWETLERLRADPLTAVIPAVMCSANRSFLRANKELLRAKGCDTLEKPFDLAELLTKVVAAIGPPVQGRVADHAA